MKKFVFLLAGIFLLSCSFIDETKAMAFHSDSYLALKNYLKEDPASKMDWAYIETVSGKAVYKLTFDEKNPLQGKKTSYEGLVTLSFYRNEEEKLRMEYYAELRTATDSGLQSVAETDDLISVCLVNELGTVLEGHSQVRRSMNSTTIGYTNIANLEGYLIILPFPDDYAFIK